MDELKKEIILLFQKNVIRDIEIKLLDLKLEGMIIPDIVFDTIKLVENSYEKN